MDPFTIPNTVPVGFCSTRGRFIDIPVLMVGFILPVEWKEETEDMRSEDSSIGTLFHSSHTSLIDVYFVLKVCRLFYNPCLLHERTDIWKFTLNSHGQNVSSVGVFMHLSPVDSTKSGPWASNIWSPGEQGGPKLSGPEPGLLQCSININRTPPTHPQVIHRHVLAC